MGRPGGYVYDLLDRAGASRCYAAAWPKPETMDQLIQQVFVIEKL